MTLSRLLLVGAAALLPIASAEWPDMAEASAPQRLFAPPQGDLVLSRTIVRRLVDGKEIRVTRRYRIHFERLDDGFRLDGVLIDVAIEAPPSLAAILDAERKRSDAGLFPVRLDRSGAILPDGTGPTDRIARQQAMAAAAGMVSSADLDVGAHQQLLDLIAKLADSTPNSPWPTDLFRAQPGERRQERQVVMADGSQGQVEVVMRVGALLDCGLPGSVERIVTTRLGGSERVSRELWSMAPAPYAN